MTFRIVARFSLFFSLLIPSCFAQTNATLSCSPVSFAEPDGTGTTDDGRGSLTITTGCQVSTSAGAAYMNSGWVYIGTPITLLNAVDITSVKGKLPNDGRASGWLFILEVSTLSQTKRFVMTMNSVPISGSLIVDTWPITMHIPAGATVKVQVYAFADHASTCSAGCFGSAQWILQ